MEIYHVQILDITRLETETKSIQEAYLPIFDYFRNHHNQNGITIETVTKQLKIIRTETKNLEAVLITLKTTTSAEVIDYSKVANCLRTFCYDPIKSEFYRNVNIWENIISLIPTNGFSRIFDYLLTRNERIKETNALVSTSYKNISINKIDKLNFALFQFNSYLVDFMANVEAICLMLQYLEREEIFSQAVISPGTGKIRGRQRLLTLISAAK